MARCCHQPTCSEFWVFHGQAGWARCSSFQSLSHLGMVMVWVSDLTEITHAQPFAQGWTRGKHSINTCCIYCHRLSTGTLFPVWDGVLWGQGNPERKKTAFRSGSLFTSILLILRDSGRERSMMPQSGLKQEILGDVHPSFI